MDEGFVHYDAADRLVVCNQRFRDIYPHLADILMPGVSFREVIETDARMRHQAGLIRDFGSYVADRIARHENPRGAFEVRQFNGNRIRIYERRTSDGGVVAIHTDVTALFARDQELERYSKLLKSTLENISQGICAGDSDLRLAIWNDTFFCMLDLPHSFRSIGTPIADMLRFTIARGDYGPCDPEEKLAELIAMVTDPRGARIERQNGSGRILEVLVRPMPGGGFVATYSDITDHRQAQVALRESEERYALAAKGANDGLWDWDLARNRIFYSTRWKQMLGHADPEIGQSPEEWFSRIHPYDVDRVTAQLDSHLAGGVSHFESEHRMLHADGSYRWMLTRGLAVRDENGRATRIAGSQTDVTDRRRTEERIVHDALHDALTALPNRTLFLDRLRQALARYKRDPAARFAVLYLDLDRFKVVNESLGHLRGDELLVTLGRRLEQAMRPGDTAARLGGDEFAVLLERVDSAAQAEAVARGIREALVAAFEIAGKPIHTTASIGLALADTAYERPEEILRDADLAMYHAKNEGRDRIEQFQAGMHRHAVAMFDLERDLRRAMDSGEMMLHYQPIVALASGRLAGFEALVRWNHSERGVISPLDFIPLAEETGLIVPLGRWVLNQACGQMRGWQAEWRARNPDDPPLMISVNLSARQFASATLVDDIEAGLRESGLAASDLRLEITETTLMRNGQRSAGMLQRLKQLSIKISVDDFGTGYSSLGYLTTFPIDCLKIDKTFCGDMTTSKGSREIVRTITDLGRSLSLDVIAEGVETAEQLAMLRGLGCHYAQGYFFSQPLAATEVEAMLARAPVW
ncbi:MAG: hypothetical protein OHK0024_06340 [Thalassobaculales bacterium]